MTTVIDRDLGWSDLVREARKLDGLEVSAGILENSGNYAKGQSLVDVAIWNEYGTSRIPSRPFIRISSDDNRNAWGKLAENCAGKVLRGNMSARSAGEAVGQQMVKDIKKVFGDKGKLAPNAPSTIKKKGHDKPLIDTGKLRDSVNYRVEDRQ